MFENLGLTYLIAKTIKYLFLFAGICLFFAGDIIEYYLADKKIKIKYGFISRLLYRLHLYERRNEIK